MDSKSDVNITLFEEIEYGFGGMFTTGLGGSIANYWWMYFLTDIALVPTVIAASAKTLVTFIKLFSMMFVGAIIDSTNMKWGKYRSWIVIGDVVMFITSGLLFLKWNYSNPVVYVGILLVIYAIQITGYNVSWTSSRALVGVMAVNTKDSVALTAAATVGSHASGIVYGVLGSVVLAMGAKTGNQYMFAAYALGLIYLIGAGVMLHVTKKYEVGNPDVKEAKATTAKPKQDKIPLKDMLSALKGPGTWFFLSSSIMNISSGMQGALLAYYTKYVLNNIMMLNYSVTAASIAAVLSALVSPWLCAKFSKKKVFMSSLILGAISYAGYFFIGSNAYLFLLLKVVYQFCATPIGTSMVAMANDIADYNAMHGAKSAKAFVQSMMGVTIRIGTLISTAAASFGLVAIGYQSGTVPTESVLKAIIAMMSFVPAAAYGIAALLIVFYKIDEKEIEQYKLSLLAAKAEAETVNE